jgi:hypothetical protein
MKDANFSHIPRIIPKRYILRVSKLFCGFSSTLFGVMKRGGPFLAGARSPITSNAPSVVETRTPLIVEIHIQNCEFQLSRCTKLGI